MHAHLESFSGVIAIDDLHVADGDDEVGAFLAALIERTKGRIRWILASRSTTSLPLGTWFAYRDADMPIDEEALRFTLDEVKSAAVGLGLATRDEELSDLLSLTEGWPAAMTFALRTSTRSTDLRNVSAITREMVYRFLAEQVYSGLDEDERMLLEVAITLPTIDVAVLERAGFDRALPTVERLRERTAFIYEESPGVYQCHELFRDFLRHQSALGGKRAQQLVHERAAQALESSADLEHAIEAYVLAASSGDVVRLLEHHGFDMLERARGDVVARAIESLDDTTRRENATILALQGTLQAIAGKFARAESLLRRSLARAGYNRDLFAITSLRLASIVANQGGDVGDLLGAVGDDGEQSIARRAEALSLIAGKEAVGGDLVAARAALDRLEPLLIEIDSDIVRAKVLHYTGIAFHHLGAANRAFEVLIQSSELASELHLYSIESRADAVLSNLALHEEDDVERQLRYAESAAAAATKAGDAYALQTALLQELSAQMRRGDVEKSISIEQRLAAIRKDDLAARYLALFRSVRLAWEGRFAEAHQLVASCWTRMPFDFDRLVSGSEYALFLALDGRREESTRLVREILDQADSSELSGRFRIRSVAIAKALGALAEAINGRATQADRIIRGVKANGDAVIALTASTVENVLARLRHRGESGADRVMVGIEELCGLGYADVAKLLGAVDRVLSFGEAASQVHADLTRSEIEVLKFLDEGLIPKEIAERTERSVYTVRVHIANIIAKLGCHGRLEAIRKAQREGLI
jgi:ATP/maltotriose-dependent transcriptional regulator MalT